MTRERGFTLIEALVTLAVLAILTVLAMPRFFSMDAARANAAARRLAADIRYAQRLAVTRHVTCGVAVYDTGKYHIFRVTAQGDVTETDPLTREAWVVEPANASVGPPDGRVTFGTRGTPLAVSGAWTVASGGASRTLTIDPVTGSVLP